MTTQQIIKKLRKEGLKTHQIAKILKATNIRAYESGTPINWRIEERIKTNYAIYLKGQEVEEALVVNGMTCKCGNQIFTHRHSNWIECTACNKIQILQS